MTEKHTATEAGIWRTERSEVTCAQSGTRHEVSVALPSRHASLDAPPLIVCMDGPWVFGSVVDATRIMSMAGEAPEAVVVGLGFVADSMSEYLRQRARWFTPTPYVPPAVTGVKGLEVSETGRALVLRDMLRDQVLPDIEARLGTGERWLVGHSFSGLFGLRVLFDSPELFSKWLLMSASIWWDGRSILGFEEAYAETHTDLSADLYLSSGGDEDNMAGGEFAMGPNVTELADRLRGHDYTGLTIRRVELPASTHSSTIGAAVASGLRALTTVAP